MKNFKALWIVYFLMIVITVVSASAVSQEDLLDGLVSYYKLDETSGSTATDSHGSNDLTHSNTGVISSSGLINYGLNFNGNTYYSEASNKVTPLGSKTISFWVYFQSTGVSQVVFANDGTSDSNHGVSSFIRSDDTVLFRSGKATAGNRFQLISTTALTDDAWNFVTLTWDGTTDTNGVKIYIDGELDVQGTANTLETVNPTYNLLFGRYSTTETGINLQSRLDEVAIFNRSLNSTEVSTLYNIQKDGFSSGSYNFTGLIPIPTNFSVSVKDFYSGVDVSDINVTVDGVVYSNISGSSVVTSLLSNDTSLYLVEVCASDYFCRNYSSVNVSTSLVAELYQAVINFTGYDLFSNVSLVDFFVFDVNKTYLSTTRVFDTVVTSTGSNFLLSRNITSFSNSFVNSLVIEHSSSSVSGTARCSEVYARFVYSDGSVWISGVDKVCSTTYSSFLINKSEDLQKNISYIEIWNRNIHNSYAGRVRNVDLTVYDVSVGLVPTNNFMSSGNFSFLFLKNNYFVKSFNGEINVFDIKNINIGELTDAQLNISLKNAWSNSSVDYFEGWIVQNDYNYNHSFGSINGSAILDLKQGLNYTVFVTATNYSVSDSNYQTIFLNTSIQDLNFSLYSNNSIVVYIRKENDTALITQNVTIKITSSNYDETFYTSTGSYLLENLNDSIYSISFTTANYTSRSYSVTVTDSSTQILTAYLSGETESVTFTVLDSGNNNALEGARVSMYRFTNGAWITVESKLTDITGKTVLSYIMNDRYKFIVSKDDYTSKTFELNPVLLAEYNVRLSKAVSFPDIPQSFTVSVSFMPKYFIKGDNNFTIFFNSPEGRFSSYGFNLTYPGETYSYSGNNAIGESNTVGVFIDDNISKYGDYVTLVYYYTVVGGDEQTFEFRLPIRDLASDLTIFDNINNKYDLNTFEKLIIMTLIIILVGGISILTAGQQVGGVVILMLFGLFSFMGFIPAWSVALVLLAGITYITSDRGRN